MASKKEKSVDRVAKELCAFLADTAIVYVKTLNFHWNMKGKQFFMYHRLLEEQYQDFAEALDALAERIQMLECEAPGSMEEFLKWASIKEAKGRLSQDQMVRTLVADLEYLSKKGQQLFALCEEVNDPGTGDLIIERLRAQDKQAWLLRSHLIS